MSEKILKKPVDVIILLATYNGEKYIREQLESIQLQDYPFFKVLISDDGSSDRTVDILLEYEKFDSRFVFLNRERKGGVVNNFKFLLAEAAAVKSNYFMFCDQDDYWLPNKISITLHEFIKNIKSEPGLVFTNLNVVDENLNVIHADFYKYISSSPLLNKDVDFINWASTVYGCTVMFNQELLSLILNFPEKIPMHDHWAAKCCAEHGRMIFLNQSTILYRQHENNQVGAKTKPFLQRLFGVKKTISKIAKQADDIICMNQCGNNLNKIAVIEKIFRLKGFSFLYRFFLLLFIISR